MSKLTEGGLPMNASQLYEKDFYAWTVEMAQALKDKTINKLDLEHLAEEIESMGASERRELASRLEILIMHLLKLEYQPDYAGKRSWTLTVKEQRKRVKRLIDKMPSLKNKLLQESEEAYEYAVIGAVKETGIAEKVFPTNLPYSLDNILDINYYP